MDITRLQENEALPSDSSKVSVKLSKILNYQYSNDSTQEKTIPSIVNNIRELPCSFMNPYLLHYNSKHSIKEDPYYNIINTKSIYNNEVDNLKTQYKLITKKKNYNIDKFEIYDKMQTLLNRDPDKYFNDEYNWYYNGGSLDVCNINDSIWIFHSENSTNLCVSKLSKNNSIWNVENKIKFNENTDHKNFKNAIFEIKSVSHNKEIILGTRLWNKVVLYNLKNVHNSNINCNRLKEYNSDIPLSSFTMSTNKKHEFITLDTEQNIKVWNISMDTKKILNVNKKHKSWGQINYLDNNNLMYVNNYSYSVIDLRTGTCVINEECVDSKEEYTNLCVGENIYLTTENNLYGLDLRNCCMVNKWTHLLKGNVFLSDSCYCSDIFKDLICVGNQNEKVVVGYQKNQLIFPKVLPSLRDTFEKNLLYKPVEMPHYISHRLGFSTTGIKFLEYDNEVSLLSINSVGDVFVYEIEKVSGKNFKNQERICNKKFSNLGKTLQDNIEKTEKLNFVDKVVINNLPSLLKSKPECPNDPVSNKKRNKRTQTIQKIKRQLKNNIAQCKTNLSDIWDLEVNIDDIEELDTSTHVQRWLSSMNANYQNNSENTFDLNTSENVFDNTNQSCNEIETD